MKQIEDRLTELEICITNQDRMLEELNDEVLRQSKIIDVLVQQNKLLIEAVRENQLKSESEETPPPHY